jgi:Acetyltransferase (GNAT) domain
MGSSRGGYADPAYAASLVDLGEPLALPRSGGSLVVREIPASAHRDATGPYPLFACEDWAGLKDDVGALAGELVAVSLVTDPFGAWTPDALQDAFPDLAVPFKEHVVVDLRRPWRESARKHHRRNAERALGAVAVERVADPATLAGEWVELYDRLVARHGIRGPAAFSAASFAAQLAVPGMVALRAVEAETTVGASLWLRDRDVAYYHLAAYTERGYELGASFALFARAFELFAEEGLAWASLGAGAGAGVGGDDDGLLRFKRGWSAATRPTYLCGRVLDPPRYAELASGAARGYFPAYRAGEHA